MARLPQGYPQQYADQESQLLAQVNARRRAFMQQHGQAQTRFVNARQNPPAAENGDENLLGDQYQDPGDGDDLFKGDMLD